MEDKEILHLGVEKIETPNQNKDEYKQVSVVDRHEANPPHLLVVPFHPPIYEKPRGDQSHIRKSSEAN
jgi:hypothetical protein